MPKDYYYQGVDLMVDKDKEDFSYPCVERTDWGAQVPRFRMKNELPAQAVILRYTETDPCTDGDSCSNIVRDIQNKCIGFKAQTDLPYSFLIGGDGNVYEGLGYLFTTIKPEKEFVKYDLNNIDIAYIGRSKDDVTPEMRNLVKKVIQHGIKRTYIVPKFVFLGDHEAVKELKS